VVQSNRAHRYTVPITVGGVQIEAALDSGSTGLRILPGVVPAAAQESSGRRSTYGYGNGVQFVGVVAEADMTIGVSGHAKFQQIVTVGCLPGLSTCQATMVKPEEFGIESEGLPNEGFKAILGINMASDIVPNPLMVLGAKRWIVELPRPREGKPGRLVLNPTDAEVADYKLLQIDGQFANQHGGLHDAIEGCLLNQATKESICGPTHLDTGAPRMQVQMSDPPERWPPRTRVTMTFFDKNKPVIAADFSIGEGPGSPLLFRSQPQPPAPAPAPGSGLRFRSRPQPQAPGTTIYLGILPYFAFSALYDPEAKIIGLKAR
jgi:hypothetical protein